MDTFFQIHLSINESFEKNYGVLIWILFWNFLLFLQSNPDDLPKYVYEITTTSFIVDENGFLVVNQPNLDRDPPNESRLSFRVFVRELLNDDPKSSRPLTITVNLKDVNDNAPILEPVRDISLVAGNTKRNIATVSKNFLFSFTGGPPLVRSPLVWFPLVRILLP